MEYGEGGVDFIRERSIIHGTSQEEGEDLGAGDVERLIIEWKSLLDLIVHGRELNISRWSELQKIAKKLGGGQAPAEELAELPELPVRQRRRFEGPIRKG